MAVLNYVESERKVEEAIYYKKLIAGNGWLYTLEPGQVFRIVDLEGNQAADTLFFDADQPTDHYSAVNTIQCQQNIYLSTGSVLIAESGKELVRIIADTCGRHDTLGGSCSAQSNTVRYSHDTLPMHNCRDTYMLQLAKYGESFTKRDLAPNVNFFMNVPVTPEGDLKFTDGVSSPGHYVEMQAISRTKVLISNCPQLNNPCNAFNPTPIQLLIWDK
ncbi:urea amidolyase associated protein UAAP2 [Peribacillus frigoritolerans]|uniref:urea amidolyase associated protein UAAP2 n=1 Tax=Peribacillus frigoritolerans TaxID=450367 RepID=UPI0020BD54BD|nr:urea amidolyase associated protein UAAP2 [Peribacillus frigoritolerans]